MKIAAIRERERGEVRTAITPDVAKLYVKKGYRVFVERGIGIGANFLDADYEKDLGLDSLEWTAIVTSIEHEFHTVFEDSFYEHNRTINDFVKMIENDFSCF